MKKLLTHSFKVTIYENGFCWKNPRWEEKTYTHFDGVISDLKTLLIASLFIYIAF